MVRPVDADVSAGRVVVSIRQGPADAFGPEARDAHGQRATGPVGYLPNSPRHSQDVQAEDSVRLRILKCPFLDHEFRSALFARWRAFFSRLKNEFDCSGKLILHAGKNFGNTHENRDVRIMTARVHHADFLSVVDRFHFRRE